jgi:hypothetical protein
MRQSEMGSQPPLCDHHKSLAPEYVVTTMPGPDGVPTQTWVRAAMGQRATEATQQGQTFAAPPA